LSRLAEAGADRMPEVSDYLFAELDRARVLKGSKIPDNLVVMGSKVTFRDASRGRDEEVTLVWPEHADIGKRRISVMTPIGAALIGLTEGQSITWPSRSGETHLLEVLRVEPPAEEA